MTDAQFADGLAYAEDNFKNDRAPHLHVDKKLIREKFDLTGKRILDFGCGMGGMTLWYATNWDCEVLGLDIDRHHVHVAETLRKRHHVNNVRFSQQNVLEHPLEERFDMIFLNDVAEHIQFPILEKIMQQLEAHLAPGGQIFVTYPPWQSPYASHVSHVTKIPWCQFLPERMLLPMIERNNLQIVGEEESTLLEAYQGLNHLTHKKFMSVLSTTGLQPVWRKSHTLLNRLSPLREQNLNFFPFSYLVTKEFILLESTGRRERTKRRESLAQTE